MSETPYMHVFVPGPRPGFLGSATPATTCVVKRDTPMFTAFHCSCCSYNSLFWSRKWVIHSMQD